MRLLAALALAGVAMAQQAGEVVLLQPDRAVVPGARIG